MSGSITIIWILGTLYGASIDGFAPLQTTLLDSAHQDEGNRGLYYRPKDLLGNDSFFTLSARTQLDQNDPYNPAAIGVAGTVFIDPMGAGVQGPVGNFGSKDISGKGPLGNEELIFDFDAPIHAASIILSLTQIRFNTTSDAMSIFRGGSHDDDGHHEGEGGDGEHDDGDNEDDGGSSEGFDMPVVFLSAVGSDTYDYIFLTSEIEYVFSQTGNDMGVLDFSAFDLMPPDLMIDSFKIRETNDHILVNSITHQVPEPSLLLLLCAGSLPLLLKRRRRSAA